jgi:hypothetical protein
MKKKLVVTVNGNTYTRTTERDYQFVVVLKPGYTWTIGGEIKPPLMGGAYSWHATEKAAVSQVRSLQNKTKYCHVTDADMVTIVPVNSEISR